jgi:hypothetical protein
MKVESPSIKVPTREETVTSTLVQEFTPSKQNLIIARIALSQES